jgi:hypothetical protein
MTTEPWSAFDQALAALHKGPSAKPFSAPFSQTQIREIGIALIDGFLAQVLLWLAGVQAFGPAVQQQLQTWSQNLQNQAQEALTNAGIAQTAATGAGANANAALNQLTALPAQNVVPKSSGSATSVTSGDVGSGGSATGSIGGSAFYLSASGTQTVGASASVLVAAVTFSLVGPSNAVGAAHATLGSGATQQQMQTFGGPIRLATVTEFLQFLVLWNPQGGTNIALEVTVTASVGGIASVSFESATYIGAAVADQVLATNSGSGSSPSLNVASAIADTMAVAAFTAGDVATKADTTLSGYTQTQLGNTTVQVNGGQYGYQSLAFGDAAGATGGVTFGASCADAFAEWVGAAVVLSAQPYDGSGFRAYPSSVAAGCSSGVNTFASSFFNTVARATADYSYDTSTNTLTVLYTGWYKIKISFLVDTYTNYLLGPVLYHNGVPVEYGINNPPTSGATISDSFYIYCNAGDTLTPGYYAGVAYSATFGNDTTGTKTFWSVSLMNRSLL